MPRKGPLALVDPLSTVQQRPEPPDSLAEPEAAIWRRLVAGMRPGWANGATEDLIGLYCYYARLVAELQAELRQLKPNDKRQPRQLRDAARMLVALATKLRLSPSSSRRAPIYAHDPTAAGPRPWEIT